MLPSICGNIILLKIFPFCSIETHALARSFSLCVVKGIRLVCKRLQFLAFNSGLSRIHKRQKHFQLTPISKLSHQFTKTIFQLSQIELVMDIYKNIPSVRHFKNCGVQNLKLTVIERVRKQDQDIRKAREKYWILRLKPSINNLVV